jgi:hypothetical protein
MFVRLKVKIFDGHFRNEYRLFNPDHIAHIAQSSHDDVVVITMSNGEKLESPGSVTDIGGLLSINGVKVGGL